jgi:hypothetical protein
MMQKFKKLKSRLLNQKKLSNNPDLNHLAGIKQLIMVLGFGLTLHRKSEI